MFCSFLLNWKSLGHQDGSETFPWQLGLVSAEANCGSCLNCSDGNGAAPECGLMWSPPAPTWNTVASRSVSVAGGPLWVKGKKKKNFENENFEIIDSKI